MHVTENSVGYVFLM